MPLSDNAARSKDRSTKTPTLQHRHFAFIAACIRAIPTPSARVEAANAFAGNLDSSNPAFNKHRFLDACNCKADTYTLDELDRAVVHATYWLEYLQYERRERGFAEHGVVAA